MAISIGRLSGGNTPADGSDPRTFPAIWNATADTLEAGVISTSLTSPATGQLLQYNGTNWVNVGQAEAGAIPVFADDAARSSAIPTPIEGMVTFREDQDVVEVYDGSAFKTVGGLVAVKSAIFTGTQTAALNGGDNVAVTDLSITHEVSDPANRLIISAFLGAAANSIGSGQVGLAIHDGAGLIAVGDALEGRSQITAGGRTSAGASTEIVSQPSVTFVHTPGAGSKTYTVRAVQLREAANIRTIFINRNEEDVNSERTPRAVSSLVIQEVAV